MRRIDPLVAAVALLLLSPLLLGISVLVWLTMGSPVFFRQRRVGLAGKPFEMIKFRSMTNGEGPEIAVLGDPRVTPLGRFLRDWKLDELPELWNVVRGDMALVGPRPEVPRYVDLTDQRWVEVLRVRPGLTDPVTLSLYNEEAFLAEADDPESFYRTTLLPEKLAGYLAYLERRTLLTDLGVLLATAWCTIHRPRIQPQSAFGSVEPHRADEN